ncbi:MAG: PTS sugar transporter subunit IIA [Proteobacteria bacterium]|jgi:PTS system nitrogen regulatory IIA component|nr:PTS sugar transporter subunit IIA [Pseudomonadota bacterium]
MGEIAKLLPRANIVTGLDVADKAQFFAAISQVFEHGSGLARAGVAASLAAREKLGSTGLGQGVAIPHGRIKGLREPVGAYARLLHPIGFGAPDGRPVTHSFVLLVPAEATERHLELLSELAQMFSDAAFRERLAHAAGADDIAALFDSWGQVLPFAPAGAKGKT